MPARDASKLATTDHEGIPLLAGLDRSLVDALHLGAIKLLRAEFLRADDSEAVLPKLLRRQELEQMDEEGGIGIFLTPEEAVAALRSLSREVAGLTYGWACSDHPDVTGEYLANVRRSCATLSASTFSSLPQKPRSAAEEELFKVALQVMGDVYASPLGTMVVRHGSVPSRPAELDGEVVILVEKGGGLDGAGAEAELRSALGAVENLRFEEDRWRVRFPTHVAAAAAVEVATAADALPGAIAIFLFYNDRPYPARGWTTFESAVSTEAIARLAYFPGLGNLLQERLPPKLIEVDGEGPRVAEAADRANEGMGPRHERVITSIQEAVFTGKADLPRVVDLYSNYVFKVTKTLLASGEGVDGEREGEVTKAIAMSIAGSGAGGSSSDVLAMTGLRDAATAAATQPLPTEAQQQLQVRADEESAALARSLNADNRRLVNELSDVRDELEAVRRRQVRSEVHAAAVDEPVDATVANVNSKFGPPDVVMHYGSIANFFTGIDGVIGPPQRNVMVAMEDECLRSVDSTESFTLGHTGLTTTSFAEWLIVVEPTEEGLAKLTAATGATEWPLETANIQREQKRALKPLDEFTEALQTKNAALREMRLGELLKEEFVAMRMYTGAIFVKLNGVLRGLVSTNDSLRRNFIQLCSSPEIADAYEAKLSGDVTAKAEAVFAQFDARGQGTMSASSLGKALRALDAHVDLSSTSMDELLRRFDADGNGSLDRAGFATLVQKEGAWLAVRDLCNKYTTTIHAMNSGIVKLSKLTKCCKVYRGFSGIGLPEHFFRSTEYGFKGGVEFTFMSTTVEREVAMAYAEGRGRSGYGVIFEIQMGMIDRGADCTWLSQYPHEREIIFNPTCALSVGTSRIEGDMIVIDVRVNVNMNARTMEQVISQRRSMLVEMAKGLAIEVKQQWPQEPARSELLSELLSELATSQPPAWFNDDANFGKAVNAALRLKQSLSSDAAATLEDLTELDLTNAMFTALPLQLRQHARKLRVLNLSFCASLIELPAWIGDFKELRTLTITGTSLEAPADKWGLAHLQGWFNFRLDDCPDSYDSYGLVPFSGWSKGGWCAGWADRGDVTVIFAVATPPNTSTETELTRMLKVMKEGQVPVERLFKMLEAMKKKIPSLRGFCTTEHIHDNSLASPIALIVVKEDIVMLTKREKEAKYTKGESLMFDVFDIRTDEKKKQDCQTLMKARLAVFCFVLRH